jgi:hypothetical protein
LPHDLPLDCGHAHPKTPGGFSQGLTVGHHPHNALPQVGRIGTHAGLLRIIRALLTFLQVALGGAWTILFAFLLVSFLGAFSVIRSTNTLEYGPGVGLLGYLCAFVGALLLRAAPRPHTRVRM